MLIDLELQLEERRRRFKARFWTWCFRLALLGTLLSILAAVFTEHVEAGLFFSLVFGAAAALSHKYRARLRYLWQLK